MNYDARIANALEQLVDLQIVSLKSSVRTNQQDLVNDINDRVIASRKSGKYVPYDEDGPEQTGCSNVRPFMHPSAGPPDLDAEPSTAELIAEELEEQVES